MVEGGGGGEQAVVRSSSKRDSLGVAAAAAAAAVAGTTRRVGAALVLATVPDQTDMRTDSGPDEAVVIPRWRWRGNNSGNSRRTASSAEFHEDKCKVANYSDRSGNVVEAGEKFCFLTNCENSVQVIQRDEINVEVEVAEAAAASGRLLAETTDSLETECCTTTTGGAARGGGGGRRKAAAAAEDESSAILCSVSNCLAEPAMRFNSSSISCRPPPLLVTILLCTYLMLSSLPAVAFAARQQDGKWIFITNYACIHLYIQRIECALIAVAARAVCR